MTTNQLLEHLEELGFEVENDDYDITIWILSGRQQNFKNKIAWINKETPLNYKLLPISHPKKEQLADIVHQYAKTSRSNRGRNIKQRT